MKSSFIPLPSGNYINIQNVNEFLAQDDGTYTAYFKDNTDTTWLYNDAAIVVAALNAPVQIAQFVGRGNYQEEATDEANSGANEFLMDLQPWQFINIASQMVYEQPTDTSDECYTHIITLTYRLYRPKAANEEAA